jgi:hypothetical protein|tara:strand:+ start:591 stop:722 length:132 start_codon:yes stop_codon:yes gene_type:complete
MPQVGNKKFPYTAKGKAAAKKAAAKKKMPAKRKPASGNYSRGY